MTTWTYDPTTDIGRCRLLVGDRTDDEDLALFSDQDYLAFLAMEGDVRMAAVAALETVASDQVLQLKVIKAGTVSLDGAAVSDAILKRAELLRQRASLYDASGAFVAFDIAEQVVGPFSARERIFNDALRQGG